MSTEQQDASCETQLDKAREAWKRIQRNECFADWLLIGVVLREAQADAMRAAKTNMPKGTRYNAEIGPFLKENGFDAIDKGARSRLVKDVMPNRIAIETWLATVEPKKRLKLNHPQTIFSAWKRAAAPPKEEESQPRPELCGIWKSATAEDRRAALDAGGIDLLLGDLSDALRKELEHRLANPHAERRLAEKDAKEEQTVAEAKKGIKARCPQLGTAPAPAPAKSRRTAKSAVMKDIGNWRKFDLETLRAAIAQEQHRSAYDERDKGGLTPKEFGRLDKMKKQEKVLAKAVASQGNTAAGVRSNGNGVPPGESAAAMMAAHAAADAADKPFKKSINL